MPFALRNAFFFVPCGAMVARWKKKALARGAAKFISSGGYGLCDPTLFYTRLSPPGLPQTPEPCQAGARVVPVTASDVKGCLYLVISRFGKNSKAEGPTPVPLMRGMGPSAFSLV